MNDIIYVGKHLQTYSVQKHLHKSWELIYCTYGEGRLDCEDGTSIKYKTGDTVIVPPNLEHSNNSERGFTNIYMNIDKAAFPFTAPVCLPDNPERHILHTFNEIFYYYHAEMHKKSIVLSALANLVFSYVIAFQNNKPLSKPVETIKNSIVNNFPDCTYHLDTFLHTLPFSYDYLRKLFKSEIGVTPHTYLTQMRLQTAEKLLSSMNHEQNVTKIALMCGFDEPLYFSRVFKKYYGCSPINYAKQKHHDGNMGDIG